FTTPPYELERVTKCSHLTVMPVGNSVATRMRPGTGCGSEPCERRVASDSREIAPQRRNPRQLTELPHAADRSRRRDFPRRRAVRGAACFRPSSHDGFPKGISASAGAAFFQILVPRRLQPSSKRPPTRYTS